MISARRAYRHARWRVDRADARAREALLAGAGIVLSRPIGVPPSRLRHEFDTIWADVRATRRARRILASMRACGVLHTVDELDIAATKRSNTIFILGSGSSVNDLTDADWAFIGTHDSIGFNYWLLQDFVPTFYFVELGTASLAEDEYILRLLDRRLPDLGGMPIIVESKCWLRHDGVTSRLPRRLRSQVFFYAPYYLRTTSFDVVEWLMRRGRWFWRYGSCDLRAIVHHRASLSAIVLFAFLAGYEEIVLAGVDLSNSVYFWEADSSVLRGAAGPPPRSTAKSTRPLIQVRLHRRWQSPSTSTCVS